MSDSPGDRDPSGSDSITHHFFSIGSIILDDIVLPDGETRMAVLGGGGTHAAMGMRLWDDRVGIVAAIGQNFPADRLEEFCSYFDAHGLQWRPVATPRAWQVYEADGRRTEVFRTSLEEFLKITPQPPELPSAYHAADGVHLLCAAPEPLLSWVRHVRSVGCKRILWEPWDIFCTPENRDDFCRLLPLVDVFSPNLVEAQRLTGLDADDPLAIAADFLADGVGCVVLRMGARGSLVALQGGVHHWIPAFQVERIVDITGAGNAYCGGFLVGLVETEDYHQAGFYGAVSASFALEQFGALYPLEHKRPEAFHRLEQMQADVSSVLPARPIADRGWLPNPRRDVFDRLAPVWDSHPKPPGQDQKLERVLSAGQILPGMTIVDMGCGTGVLTPGLLQRCLGRILAIDLSPSMLAILADKFGPGEFVLPLAADASLLPLAGKTVDRIFCHAVFPHFPEPRIVLREFRRILRPGSRLVISHSAGRELVNVIHRQAADEILHHDLLLPSDELVSLLKGEGYHIHEVIDDDEIYLLVAGIAAVTSS